MKLNPFWTISDSFNGVTDIYNTGALSYFRGKDLLRPVFSTFNPVTACQEHQFQIELISPSAGDSVKVTSL